MYKNLLRPVERHQLKQPALENPPNDKTETQKKTACFDRNIRGQKRFDDEELASIKAKTKRFIGINIGEADKKLCSILFLALEKKAKETLFKNSPKRKFSNFPFKGSGTICL